MTIPGKSKWLILLDQAVFSGTSFLITIMVARMSDLESFGVYTAYMLAIYLTLSALGAFTIQPFQVLLGKAGDKASYISFVFWFQIVLLLVVLFAVFGVLRFFIPAIPLPVILFALGFIFQDFSRKLLLALDKPLHTLILDAASSVALLSALLFFGQSSEKEISILMQYFAVAYIVPGALLLLFVRPIRLSRDYCRHFFYLHVKEGKWLFFTALTQWWSGNLFVVASGLYLGAAALGALRLAQSLVGVLNVLLQTFENYILPQTALKINNDQESGIKYLSEMSRKAGLLFLPILAVTWLFSEQIMILAGGQEYAKYSFVLQGMALLYVLVFINQPVRLMVRAMLLNQHFFYGYAVSLTFALIFSHSLLSGFGLSGAIAGLSASQFLLMSYWLYILKQRNIRLWKSFISY
jgi:O-antigen/teichoic acid export membrane protein